MPRGGIRKNNNNTGRAPRDRCRSVPQGGVKKSDRSRTKRAVSLCATGWHSASLTLVPRSLLLNRKETLAMQGIADQETSVALRHGVASKKKRSVADQESGIALCHGVALKKKKNDRRER